ncbi:MAG: hypothetical protein KGJ59_04690 [Bacteroidota bacterium]|nr:hypothetical protein [Bacteroidota bacterium]
MVTFLTNYQLKKAPRFKNEDEERVFWAKHSPLDYEHGPVLRGNLFPNLKPTTVMTSIRLPLWLQTSLKTIANKKDVPVQSLMKMYLSEKVEEEMRSASRR